MMSYIVSFLSIDYERKRAFSRADEKSLAFTPIIKYTISQISYDTSASVYAITAGDHTRPIRHPVHHSLRHIHTTVDT